MNNSTATESFSTDISAPDRDTLVGRAEALREKLWEDAEESDRERRLTERAVSGVTGAGLMRLMTPKRMGGYQADVRTLLDVATELGRGCPSTAWVTGVLNVGNFVVSLFPEEAQEEVWRDNPDARTALVLGVPSRAVEPVDGGAVVSGEWAYASGSLHCEWVCLLVALGADTPQPHFALFRAEEVRVKDTWFFTGMRGTGSNTVVADRVFVPRHRLLPYLPVRNGEMDGLVDADNLYRNSMTGVFSLGLLGALIGGADAALRYVREKAPTRPVAGATYANQAESPTTQLALTEAATRIDTAELHARRIADTVHRHARAGRNPDLLTRARSRMDAAYVAQQCREAVDVLVTAYGSSAFHESNPLQRIWRDINVGSRHAGFGMGIPQQLYGRALVGADPRQISVLV
ncbi:acyl-CoA dehydrogenase family protein [Thermobifida halotolerans]|uniref:Acyl-CoA dehydrogenase family protein n=1 Tax=Thermobifida halotolerans TaxID=483545 RepID=A0A399G0C1_9ACTN|nr:acyl-CoA dehydrogenase family protein [Thermobifida halotolerans]UOE21266.1 acyl-CoA dehydrogenase family protein [Thermobifida halotolerans]